MSMRVFVSMIVISSALSAAIAGDTQPENKNIRLPVGAEAEISMLTASADGQLLGYKVSAAESPSDKPGTILPPGSKKTNAELWAFEPASGKTVNLSALVQLQDKDMTAFSMAISDDGDKVVVSGRKSLKEIAAFVVDTKTQDVTKLANLCDDFHSSQWVGRRFYMSIPKEPEGQAESGRARSQEIVKDISVYDADTGKISSLGVCGVVIGGSVKGKYLMVACDPDNMTKPFSKSDADKLQMVRLSMDGKLLGKIGQLEKMARAPVISPDGRYIAYNIQVRENDKRKQFLKLIEAESGKEIFSIEGWLYMTAVSNDGDVIAWDATQIQHGKPMLTGKRISKDGKAVVIAENVPAKLASWNSAFYLEKTGDGNEHPWVVKKLDFDSPEIK